jgi:REP element-mobilizing transposase RayT
MIGDAHHYMVHSIDSALLFRDTEDCDAMLGLLDKYLPKHQCRCYGFAFQENHLHLILRPSGDKDDFSRMMQSINGMYSRYYNKKYQRRGYLFWDRPKTKPTRDLEYLYRLIVYVHRNPIRSEIIKNPEQLRYYDRTSHKYLFEKSCPHKWLHVAYMKALLVMKSHNKANYLNEYLQELFQFEDAEFDAWKEPDLRAEPLPNGPNKCFRSERQWIRLAAQRWSRLRKQRERLRKIPNHLSKLAEVCSKKYDLYTTIINFRSDCDNYRAARAIFCYLTVTVGGYSAVLIGRILGVSQSTVLRAAIQGETPVEGILSALQ